MFYYYTNVTLDLPTNGGAWLGINEPVTNDGDGDKRGLETDTSRGLFDMLFFFFLNYLLF